MSALRTIHSLSDLATALRGRRAQRKIKQSQLAENIAVSRYTIIDMEKGDGDPKLSTILKAAEALGYKLVLVPNEEMQTLSLRKQPQTASSQFIEIEELDEFPDMMMEEV